MFDVVQSTGEYQRCHYQRGMSFPKGHTGFRTKESYRLSAEKLAAQDVPSRFKKGITPWNKGKQGLMPEPWNKGKKFDLISTEGNVNWKGEDASYFAKHIWMTGNYGNPKKCEHCGVLGKKTGRSWSIHWANISGKYLRDTNDWLRLCAKCHSAFDRSR